MNIFLPYENDIAKSVQSLDDLRLNKQILECYQLLQKAIHEVRGGEVKGYKNHPIYVHYKDNRAFLAVYGYYCCTEFQKRFRRTNKLAEYFVGYIWIQEIDGTKISYKPFYMEGSKGQPNYIRTTENVSELYQRKLCAKWDSDKAKGRPPKWTNREVPSFYKEWCDNEKQGN